MVLSDREQLPIARAELTMELAAIDLACSRFRADSEISHVLDHVGESVPIGPLLAEAIRVSLRAAELSDGLVDPTVGSAVRALGYVCDFSAVAAESDEPAPPAHAAPGWWRVSLDDQSTPATVLVPEGTLLDLGATAKALAADRAATRIATQTGCGVVVNLGGDLSTAGPTPEGGWQVRVRDDHAASRVTAGPTVRIASGGLATSSTTVRTWQRAGRVLHHIVDPRTGDVPAPVWRTVSVAAGSCVDANTASTAAIILGERAPHWLARRRLPARLVSNEGAVTTVCGWPDDDPPEASK